MRRVSVEAGLTLIGGVLLFALTPICAVAQTNVSPTNPCPRFAPGSTIPAPPDLFSSNGRLTVNFSYNTMPDPNGNTRYCFTTPNGTESPTLHVNPGDTLTVIVKNNLPAPTSAASMAPVTNASTVCGAATQNAASVNIHYHGTNTSPACHSDEVIHTLINSGQTFIYNLVFPTTEPPGLYWYHPHVHGLAEAAVQGGASGAIVVEGIQNVQPAVAGLPERVFVIRDQLLPVGDPGESAPGGPVPGWDLSVNYVPVLYPNFVPGNLQMKPGEKEFWRVSNSCADTVLDLQVVYDGVPQTIQIVGLDGVPTGSQDGTTGGTLVPVTDILVPPAGRVEFIVTGPAVTVKNAVFQTLFVNTGPAGDNDPQRPLFTITPNANAPEPALQVAAVTGPAGPQLFAGLAAAPVTAYRTIYFSEDNANQQFFITVQGQTPTLFSPTNPPSIVTTQGSVEEWTIQNQTSENHEFHLHQVHFLLLARNGVPVPPSQQQYLDMVQVPFNPNADPTVNPPSVTVKVDFRGPDTGDFVYHCHILNHEDNGMMAIIQVNPASTANTAAPAAKSKAAVKPAAPTPQPVAAAIAGSNFLK
jgi:FtsP/CotA-like multicopper oxidase with cupredoxin domain